MWNPGEIYTTESYADKEGDEESDYHIMKQLSVYFKQYQTQDGRSEFRDQISNTIHTSNPYIEVNIDTVMSFNGKLGQLIFNQPERCLDLFEKVILEYVEDIYQIKTNIQVLLTTNATPTPVREIDTKQTRKLVVVPGMVISTSPVSSRATEIKAICSGCGHELNIQCAHSGFTLPRKCQRVSEKEGGPAAAGGSCPLDPYSIVPDFSKFTDYQYIKIQEAPEDVPAGEMPRHISGSVDRALSNRLIPGKRCLFIAILQMVKIGDRASKQVLKIVGLIDKTVENRVTKSIDELRTKFPDRESIVKAIAPEICGMEDVKEAIACQLFSGVRKTLPDGMNIRGDINVLLLGDPSVAKSQLLKFAYLIAPIGVYTSGKGSSAAGLTASVLRQKGSSEFFLEGGAMVLADGGLVCIDEFDKMRESDRVAIHEAMEQQTISIAKAGITAVLNTRTAVLAAANPIQGRFDDLKSARDNVDFQTTILSRFDLIFVLRDVIDENRDRQIATHVLNIHTNANIEGTDNDTIQDLKRYIQYARQTYHPVINESAVSALENEYVQMRSQVDNDKTIPLTVRQLEALIRVTESLAKMELTDEAREQHVKEAIRLFTISTFKAADTGLVAPDGHMTEEQRQEVERVKNYINRRCPVGSRITESGLLNELRKSYTDFAIVRVLQTMLFNGQFEFSNQRRMLRRVSSDNE